MRRFVLVALLFLASMVASVYHPQQELWLMGGSLFLGEGIRRGYMAWYGRKHDA